MAPSAVRAAALVGLTRHAVVPSYLTNPFSSWLTAMIPRQLHSRSSEGGGGGAGGRASWDLDTTLRSVVRVATVHSRPSYRFPWQLSHQDDSGGSGFVVACPPGSAQEGASRWVLTNAHVVADSVAISLHPSGSAAEAPARVVATCHEWDLALLETDSPALLGAPPLPMDGEEEGGVFLAGLPALQQRVLVAGFQTGHAAVSVAEGSITRIDRITYAHSGVPGLALAVGGGGGAGSLMGPGASGGPALCRATGRVLGVAFQNLLNDGGGSGFLIPTAVVRRFLAAVASGRPP
eukprot:CAMPEP_0117689786 /NCGR_PEP_ID=MMETSP0804-20121206/24729_1 /TAXON_ID=1074897 /ORGANISM="Tetraselmis astigmatica, Strain CCMP880" /LENGTH=291 /DNA_ID=CAMNT_0005502689 /DNA_START=102 /DNA_END=974 /DNA_ORIENTATION=-